MKATGSKLMHITRFNNGKEVLSIDFDTDLCKYILSTDTKILAESKFYDQLAQYYSENKYKTTGDYNV